MVVLPVLQAPCSSYRITLDGLEYRVSFRWQDRNSSWYFDLSKADGTPLIQGRRVVTGWPLTFGTKVEGMPPGQVMVIAVAPLLGVMDDLWTSVAVCYYADGEFVSSYIPPAVSVSVESVPPPS